MRQRSNPIFNEEAALGNLTDTTSLTHHYPAEYTLTYSVGAEEAGLRLDAFLKRKYPRRTRASLQRLIKTDDVQINRDTTFRSAPHTLKPGTTLLSGDSIHLLFRRKPEPPVNLKYKILHDENGFLVISKSAPLPIHPAGSFFFNTLLTHLKTNGYTQSLESPDYFPVHRLDRETSGIILVAKDAQTCAALVKQFRKRTIEKMYEALVWGHLKEAVEVCTPLRRAVQSKIKLKMEVAPSDKKALNARSYFMPIKYYTHPIGGPMTLVQCKIETGRQHQIRVHLASIGHPIVGDKLYSISEDLTDLLLSTKPIRLPDFFKKSLIFERHALHAQSLSFDHPQIKRRLRFSSPFPSELLCDLQEVSKPIP